MDILSHNNKVGAMAAPLFYDANMCKLKTLFRQLGSLSALPRFHPLSSPYHHTAPLPPRNTLSFILYFLVGFRTFLNELEKWRDQLEPSCLTAGLSRPKPNCLCCWFTKFGQSRRPEVQAMFNTNRQLWSCYLVIRFGCLRAQSWFSLRNKLMTFASSLHCCLLLSISTRPHLV